MFLIPIAEDLQVYGQVVDQTGVQFLVVLFRTETGSIDDVTASGIELAGIVFDAKFRKGDCPIIANQVPVEVKSPWFVAGGLGKLRLTNFDDSVERPATADEASEHWHRDRTIATPMALQWRLKRSTTAETGSRSLTASAILLRSSGQVELLSGASRWTRHATTATTASARQRRRAALANGKKTQDGSGPAVR